jgi:prevent-host-death family protein
VKRKTFRYPVPKSEPIELKEAALLDVAPMLINVRAAKDQLSSLLERAASGNEVIITSDGVPKAKLVPFLSARRPFQVDWEHLRSMQVKSGGMTADKLVREDRDGRP